MAERQQDANPKGRGGWALPVGLILTGLLVNKWSVEQLVIPDGHMEGPLNIATVVGLQTLCIVLGGVWLRRRPRFLGPRARPAASVAVAATAALGAYGSVQALRPPAWQVPGLTMVERLEIIADETTFYKLEAERSTWRYRAEMAVVDVRARLGLDHDGGALELLLKEARYELQRGGTPKAIEILERITSDPATAQMPEGFLQTVRDHLAIAYLRLGEQQNCIDRHHARACYLPLPREGVHELEFGSRAAIGELEATLAANPDDLSSRWLLNIAYMTLGEHPEGVPHEWLIPIDVFRSDFEVATFHDVAPDAGVNVLSLSGGSVLDDFDGDGDLDVLASGTGLRDQLRFFRNDGDGSFTDATESAGLLGQLGGLNLAHADYDNDGYPDVLVLRGGWMTFDSGEGNHPNSLLRNNGNGTFTDVTEQAGVLRFHPVQVGAWGDYDNDGWLDLFLGNESWKNQEHPPELFHNNGDGTFTDRAADVGITSLGYIKGAAWGDYDNDGLLDLYISRMGQPNVLYRNEGEAAGEWSFSDRTASAGVGEPHFSFPTWFWDYDNDGWLDLFVAGFGGKPTDTAALYGTEGADHWVQDDVAASYLGLEIRFAESARLFRNERDGTFDDVTREAGLEDVIHVMGANFGDIDNDGYLDMYLGTGTASYRSLMPNRMLRSDDGRAFQDVTTAAGVGHLQKGHGISFGDVDHDGDQDVYAQLGGWFAGDVFQNALFENPGTGGEHHWVTLRLRGEETNRLAVGARITVTVRERNRERQIHRVVSTGGSFGASSLQQEIGLGRADEISSIEIWWPVTGERQVFLDVPVDGIYEAHEGRSNLLPISAKTFRLSEMSHR